MGMAFVQVWNGSHCSKFFSSFLMGLLFLWLIVKSVISSQQLSLASEKKSHFSLAALFISDILIYFQVIICSLTYEQLLDFL